jgi:hypothetical protein
MALRIYQEIKTIFKKKQTNKKSSYPVLKKSYGQSNRKKEMVVKKNSYNNGDSGRRCTDCS